MYYLLIKKYVVIIISMTPSDIKLEGNVQKGKKYLEIIEYAATGKIEIERI